jgi:hypothetical protein
MDMKKRGITGHNYYHLKYKKENATKWGKGVIIIGIVVLFLLIVILRSYTDDEENKFIVHPSQIEWADEDSQISFAFGLIEKNENENYDLFPVRILLKSGNTHLFLELNGLSILMRSGIHFGNEVVVTGVHYGDVISVGGPVKIVGNVQGNVWSFGSDILLVSGSKVTGDVVAYGGEITAEWGSVITGNKLSDPEVNIPFLGLLTSPQSAETLLIIVEVIGIILFLLALFLVIHFAQNQLLNQTQALTDNWQSVLLYILVSVFAIPLLVILMAISIFGLLLIPVLFVFMLISIYLGFQAVCVRIGRIFIKSDADSPLKMFLSGLLGIFILKAPTLLGHFFSLVTSDIIIGIGVFLKFIGTIIIFLVLIYGFGSSLVALRKREY